ncbi:MAG: restriction endonuclease subunit S, partial [Bacteroidales bacterium]|nr:restriction endonuclease subunit S [Bacteroidales bacterium]
MQRYDTYKDSGVQWLGEIPSHWEMKRWRFLMSENTTKNTNCKERLQLQFRYGDIVRKVNQSEESDVLDTISKYTIVEPDDIMINGLNLNYDFISQRVAQVQERGVITSAYISLRPTEIANSRYFTYFLKSMDAKKMFHGMGTGIRLTLSYNELKNQFIPCPSPEEQTAIANYLDTATAKIDAAIAQQQKMIDLLNERKQIIINRAVTKGLNPNAKMKDSGVEWIGEVPEGWEVRKLKHIAKLQSGDTISSDSFTETGYPVFGGNGFRGYTNRFTNDGDYVLI